jgi:hypothetical protein
LKRQIVQSRPKKKLITKEISEEEAGITRRQGISKAPRISVGAYGGIPVIHGVEWMG